MTLYTWSWIFLCGYVLAMAGIGGFTASLANTRDRSDAPLNLVMGMVMGMSVNHMADPTDIEEKMVEARWLSPDDERLRWTVGASHYDYAFLTLVWSQYGVIVDGIVDQFPPAQQPQPNVIISEMSENSAVFANLAYDLTERTTLSPEGRYQSEDMTNVNQIAGEAFANTTKSFVRRLAINHGMDNGMTLYGQVARRINPAGVIPAARRPRVNALTSRYSVWARSSGNWTAFSSMSRRKSSTWRLASRRVWRKTGYSFPRRFTSGVAT